MEKLVQVSEQEIKIDFSLNRKCRTNIRLTSLSSTVPVAFKVQTSSPHKFLVKPPTGLIPPLSYATFQVVLKPQPHLPATYPRSPSDKFLIKTAEFAAESNRSESLNSWFNKGSNTHTHDIKMKVAFVGPVLLRHGVESGDCDAVRHIIRRQRTILAEFPPGEAESLLRVATGLGDPESMVNLLLEAGLRIEPRVGYNPLHNVMDAELADDAMDERRVAEASDRLAGVLGLREPAGSLLNGGDEGKVNGGAKMLRKPSAARKSRNGNKDMDAGLTSTGDHGRPVRDVVPDKDKLEMGEQLLMASRIGDRKHVELLFLKGADTNYCDQYGLTALHAAAIKGHRDVTLMLIEFGLDLESQDCEGHTPLHLAVVGGSLETVESLIRNGANVNAKSKSGATPLYMATAMGYDDITEFLISRGG